VEKQLILKSTVRKGIKTMVKGNYRTNMDMLDFVLHVKITCKAHKLLMAEMADPERRHLYIAEMASDMEKPVEKVEELLDTLARECWIVSEIGTQGKKDTDLPIGSRVSHGNIGLINPPPTDAGGHQSDRCHGGFDSIKFLVGVMECYGQLLREKCRKEYLEEFQRGASTDNP